MSKLFGTARTGQAIVELALVASVLILLVTGTLVFGQLFMWLHTLNNAVRDAARLGATCYDPDNDGNLNEHIVARICQATAGFPNQNSITITITERDPSGNLLEPVIVTSCQATAVPPGIRRRGGSLTVTVTYDAPVVPIPGVLSSPRRLRSSATFRMECDRN
jgi:Flp pilus assembly protein TadG